MRRHTRNGQAALTLLEVIFSMAVFAIALMGVASAFMLVERSQQMTKERLGAMLAAKAMIEEVQNYVDMNMSGVPPFPDNLDALPAAGGSYNQIGFHVYNASSETGADRGLVGAAGVSTVAASGGTNFLKPATHAGPDGTAGTPDDMFPTSRATSTYTDVTTMAGYIEVSTPDAARPALRQVTVTIAWKTYGGDTKLVISSLVGPKVK